MTEDPASPTTVRPNPWVRWLVVGLPFGLLFMGAFSFVFYFQKRNAAREIQPSRYSSIMRKDLNLAEYQRYLKVLAKDIGLRTPDQPGNVEAAQSFIQSTLGYDNMGYDVVRRDLGKSIAYEASLPAASAPRQLVLVCARYDGVNAESISALFSLAHALTGSTHRNNIRFFAFAADGDKISGYSEWNAKEEFTEVVTLYITNPGETPVSLGGKLVPLAAPVADDPAALVSLKHDEESIKKYGDASDWK